MVSPYKYSRDYPLHNICRNTEHSQADVVPACQLTLKNLQLDYVDLYLVSVCLCVCACVCVSVFTHNYNFPQIHWPQALPRGVTFAELKDEHYLGYSEERIADTWKVSTNDTLYTDTLCVSVF